MGIISIFLLLVAITLFSVCVIFIFSAFGHGLIAFRMSRQRTGPDAATLRFLGINLCEPLVTSLFNILFLVLLISHLSDLSWEASIFSTRFVLLLPMAVLLLPALGWLRPTVPIYRNLNGRIFALGVARTGITFLILSGPLTLNVWLLLLLPFVFLGGVWLLGYSNQWGRQLLHGRLLRPYAPQTPLAVSSNSSTLPAPQLLVQATQPAVFPRLPALAAPLLCPLCHTPTTLEEADCSGCGLVFRSRVPEALQSLARYTALRPLGTGGMSSVYLAHDQTEDQFCVIKTLVSVDAQRDADWSREAAVCLRREAELLGQVEHPRIARLLDRVSTDQGEFLVLEYIAGRTLEQHLTRIGPNSVTIPGAALPLEEALAYAASVAATLDYLATLPQPLLHLDIKPANLILPPDQNEPILVDFGGAMLWQQTGATTRLAGYGTPGYAAPEQYQGQASPQSDVYGLGATLYHLLTDDDPTAHPLDFPALAILPPDIATLLASALEHDSAARPTAAVLRGDLMHQYPSGTR